jgi:hypothetical protein
MKPIKTFSSLCLAGIFLEKILISASTKTRVESMNSIPYKTGDKDESRIDVIENNIPSAIRTQFKVSCP